MEYRKGSCLYRYIHVLPWILRYKPNILNEIIFYLWMLCIVVFAAKTGKFLTSDLKGVHSTFTNRRIFVYIFCLISIGLSLSGEGMIKWNLWISKEHNYNNFNYLWKFEPDIPNSFGEILFENPKIYKECISSTFCHPVILQFLTAAIFFVTDWKGLKLAKTA